MPYIKTEWQDEVPGSTPIKYSITDDVSGEIAGSAIIEVVTSITPGTPVNAGNLNHMEQGIEDAQAAADEALSTVNAILNFLHPVGSLYLSTVATNPNTLFGFGTWEAFGAGRTLVGVGVSDANYAAGAQGGASTHQLTPTEMPTHTHTQNAHNHTQNAHTHINGEEGKWWAEWVSGSSEYGIRTAATQSHGNQPATATNQSAVATNQNAGGNGAHNNMPPYIVVYFWKRTA